MSIKMKISVTSIFCNILFLVLCVLFYLNKDKIPEWGGSLFILMGLSIYLVSVYSCCVINSIEEEEEKHKRN